MRDPRCPPLDVCIIRLVKDSFNSLMGTENRSAVLARLASASSGTKHPPGCGSTNEILLDLFDLFEVPKNVSLNKHIVTGLKLPVRLQTS